jgi:hypothetical protein
MLEFLTRLAKCSSYYKYACIFSMYTLILMIAMKPTCCIRNVYILNLHLFGGYRLYLKQFMIFSVFIEVCLEMYVYEM